MIYARIFVLGWLMVIGAGFPHLARAQDGLILTAERDLDPAPLQAAAQPLLDRGAQVAIYWVNSGGVEDFDARLTADGLMQQNLVADDLIAIYVSMDPQYSEIRWGDQWNRALILSGDVIREDSLNPNLRERQYERAFTQTLTRINDELSAPFAYTRFEPEPERTDYTWCFYPLVFLMLLASWAYQLANPRSDDEDDDGGYSSRPLYKSSWGSGGARSGRSARSSISRSRSSSFGKGGRSGGKW